MMNKRHDFRHKALFSILLLIFICTTLPAQEFYLEKLFPEAAKDVTSVKYATNERSGQVLVVWKDNRPVNRRIYAAIFSKKRNGTVVLGAPVLVSPFVSQYPVYEYSVAYNAKSNKFAVAWSIDRVLADARSQYDIHTRILDGKGRLKSQIFKTLKTPDMSDDYPVILSSGACFELVWNRIPLNIDDSNIDDIGIYRAKIKKINGILGKLSQIKKYVPKNKSVGLPHTYQPEAGIINGKALYLMGRTLAEGILLPFILSNDDTTVYREIGDSRALPGGLSLYKDNLIYAIDESSKMNLNIVKLTDDRLKTLDSMITHYDKPLFHASSTTPAKSGQLTISVFNKDRAASYQIINNRNLKTTGRGTLLNLAKKEDLLFLYPYASDALDTLFVAILTRKKAIKIRILALPLEEFINNSD